MESFKESIRNQTDVSVLLTKHVISTKAKDKNFVISPLSIHVVFNLIVAASKGSAHEKLLRFLKSKSKDDLISLTSNIIYDLFVDGKPLGGPEFSFANGIWVDHSIKLRPDFKLEADRTFKAASKNVDFQNQHEEVREEINEWVAQKTKNLIKDIFGPGSLSSLTRVILGNAMYFKGVWQELFDPKRTREYEFFLLNGNDSVRVPFMTEYMEDKRIREFDNFQVLQLPYKRGRDRRRFSMLFFLPCPKDGLSTLVDKICTEPGFIENHLPNESMEVRYLRIPKFKIEFGFESPEAFESMGLELPGLTDVTESENLDISSSIMHKAVVEVNEQGTEAAAVTMGLLCGSCGPGYEKPVVDFVADHPFFFVIREDNTGAVFFIGQVTNPLN